MFNKNDNQTITFPDFLCDLDNDITWLVDFVLTLYIDSGSDNIQQLYNSFFLQINCQTVLCVMAFIKNTIFTLSV